MRLVVRLLTLLVVVPATYYFVYWVPFSVVPFVENREIRSVISLLCATAIGWYVWKALGAAPTGLISSTVIGAVVTGAVGFCAGFFGPLVFTPEANQGPMLGIFFTGPLSFLLGGVGGAVYWLITARKRTKE